MKKILSLGLLALVVVVSALSVAPIVSAQTSTPTEARCEAAKARLTMQIAKVETIKTNQMQAYTAIQTRVAEVVTSAGNSAFDTTTLVAAQTAFDTAIVTHTESVDTYTTALLTAKDTECTAANTEFVAAITTARAALKTARESTADVRATFREEVVPAVKEYATWLKENTDREETN